MSVLERIKQCIRERNYLISSHAEEEMAEDGFERHDVENAILTGLIQRKLTMDFRGTRYRIRGTLDDGRSMSVLCRFRGREDLIVITVYKLEK